MSTDIKPEVSEKNPYRIEKHRYYELKHFCLQYPLWKKAYSSIHALARKTADGKRTTPSDPTFDTAERLLYFASRMALVEKCANKCDVDIAPYILVGVTEGISYDCLQARYGFIFSRERYYDAYRQFFWELHKARQ